MQVPRCIKWKILFDSFFLFFQKGKTKINKSHLCLPFPPCNFYLKKIWIMLSVSTPLSCCVASYAGEPISEKLKARTWRAEGRKQLFLTCVTWRTLAAGWLRGWSGQWFPTWRSWPPRETRTSLFLLKGSDLWWQQWQYLSNHTATATKGFLQLPGGKHKPPGGCKEPTEWSTSDHIRKHFYYFFLSSTLSKKDPKFSAHIPLCRFNCNTSTLNFTISNDSLLPHPPLDCLLLILTSWEGTLIPTYLSP